jgi:hypothetical protein
MSAIKQCPFCGGSNLEISTGSEDREGVPTNIYCDDCGTQGPWQYLDPSLEKHKGNLEFVADATGWNSRVGNDYESVMEELCNLSDIALKLESLNPDAPGSFTGTVSERVLRQLVFLGVLNT